MNFATQKHKAFHSPVAIIHSFNFVDRSLPLRPRIQSRSYEGLIITLWLSPFWLSPFAIAFLAIAFSYRLFGYRFGYRLFGYRLLKSNFAHLYFSLRYKFINSFSLLIFTNRFFTLPFLAQPRHFPRRLYDSIRHRLTPICHSYWFWYA